jgi:hypothetical protein
VNFDRLHHRCLQLLSLWRCKQRLSSSSAASSAAPATFSSSLSRLFACFAGNPLLFFTTNYLREEAKAGDFA